MHLATQVSGEFFGEYAVTGKAACIGLISPPRTLYYDILAFLGQLAEFANSWPGYYA